MSFIGREKWDVYIRCSECWWRLKGADRFIKHIEVSHKDVWSDLERVYYDPELEKVIGIKKTGERVVLGVAM